MRLLTVFLLLLSSSISTAQANYDAEVVVEGLDVPWALTQLPGGGWLITERSGQLIYFKDGKKSLVQGTPSVFFAGQGGLLDVELHPDFTENHLLFLSYAKGDAGNNALTLYKATFNQDAMALENGTDIFSITPGKDTPVHYGGRIAVTNDALLLASGDGFDYRESAQIKNSMLGKVLRMGLNGKVKADNPFAADDNAAFVWTLGHRNPQALLFDVQSGVVYSHEHGPAGGDEINIIKKGLNYGWPVITNGKDYSGANISPFKEYPGMQQPLLDWTPSIAPSDMLLYRGNKFAELNGHLLVTTLKTRELRLVKLKEGKVAEQVTLLTHLDERLRGIEQDQQGDIYLLTDSGKLLLLTQL
ncbi:PQQ-dependent sugar dehydrogenase [Planctobacterium marinum]